MLDSSTVPATDLFVDDEDGREERCNGVNDNEREAFISRIMSLEKGGNKLEYKEVEEKE